MERINAANEVSVGESPQESPALSYSRIMAPLNPTPPHPPLTHTHTHAPLHTQRDLRKIRSVEPMYNHLEWDQHARDAEKLALQLTEFQRLPIGAERRRSPTRGMGTSPRMGASGQQGDMMSMSHLSQQQQQHMGVEGGGSDWARGGGGGGGGDMYQYQQQQMSSSYQQGSSYMSQQGQQQQQQGGSQYGMFSGGMGLNPSSSFIGGGGLSASRGGMGSSGMLLPTPGAGSGLGNPSYSLPGLGDSLGGGGGGGSRGEARTGLATPGGTTLGSLGPSAAALLAKYGYSSVLNGGGGGGAGQPPSGGSAVPMGLGPATGEYPRVSHHPTGQPYQ
jgi:hypothetical protein